MVNTFLFAGAAATAGVIITLGVAYIVTRRLVPFAGVLGFLCMAPFVIPGVVLAIGFYAAYAPPPLALYGTALILILAFTTRFLPIGYVNSSAAMRSINPEMEEAVRILGGNRLTALRRVVAPLLKRSLLGAWLLIFIPATRELSSAIFLYGPRHQGRVGDDLRHERGGEFRVPRRPGADPADPDPAAARGSASARSDATSC